MSTKIKRPARFTMEGMIYNADMVLTDALNPENSGIPKEMFEKCHGIVLLQIVTAGIIFSGSGGSGVMMHKHPDGTWSPPCAVDLVAFGGGAIVGSDVKHTIIFIMDQESMEDFGKNPQTRLGGEASIVLGKFGREGSVGMDLPHKGTVTVSYKKGVFGGIGLSMGTLGACPEVNRKYYGGPVEQEKILFDKYFKVPFHIEGIKELHEKLALLEHGKTWVPGEADRQKSERLLESARLAADED